MTFISLGWNFVFTFSIFTSYDELQVVGSSPIVILGMIFQHQFYNYDLMLNIVQSFVRTRTIKSTSSIPAGILQSANGLTNGLIIEFLEAMK